MQDLTLTDSTTPETNPEIPATSAPDTSADPVTLSDGAVTGPTVTPRYRLVVCSGDTPVVSLILDRELILGRGQDADIALPADEALSRRHAKISVESGRVQVEDLGSANGTFVRVSQRERLNVSDEIQIGASRIRIERI